MLLSLPTVPSMFPECCLERAEFYLSFCLILVWVFLSLCYAGNQIQGLGHARQVSHTTPSAQLVSFPPLAQNLLFGAHDQFSTRGVQASSCFLCLHNCYTEDSGMKAPTQAHSEEGF